MPPQATSIQRAGRIYAWHQRIEHASTAVGREQRTDMIDHKRLGLVADRLRVTDIAGQIDERLEQHDDPSPFELRRSARRVPCHG